MATPINLTWLQMQLLSTGGNACREVAVKVAELYPGHTDSTVMDILTVFEGMRAIGRSHTMISPSIRYMNQTQRRDLVVYLLNQISSRIPVGWAKAAATQTKISEIVDCLNTPTAGKKSALQTWASSVVIDYSDVRSNYIERALKGICNLLSSDAIDRADIDATVEKLIRIAVEIAGVSRSVAFDAVLTRVEKILGIID